MGLTGTATREEVVQGVTAAARVVVARGPWEPWEAKTEVGAGMQAVAATARALVVAAQRGRAVEGGGGAGGGVGAEAPCRLRPTLLPQQP